MFWIILIAVIVVFCFIGGLYGNISQQQTARALKEMNKRQKGQR